MVAMDTFSGQVTEKEGFGGGNEDKNGAGIGISGDFIGEEVTGEKVGQIKKMKDSWLG